jgi:uncharacterized protein (DUF2236 family)
VDPDARELTGKTLPPDLQNNRSVGDSIAAMPTFVETLRHRVTGAAAGPFRHTGYPLARSFDHMGDPGLFGPGSVTWTVMSDVATFIGGIRALLIQAAHPEVAAGVFDHSDYRSDPLGRLSRTSAYVTATAFGAKPEVEQAISIVRAAHRGVSGTSHRGRTYSAAAPEFGAWVHNALIDSFLTCYRVFGRQAMSSGQPDAFVAEQTEVGRMLGADPLPATAARLTAWIADHPDLAPSPGMTAAVEFLRSPPLAASLKAGYRIMFWAAAATIPARIRRILGIRAYPGAILLGRLLIRSLRWAMGASPSWKLALIRVGAEVPEHLFTQQLPPEALAHRPPTERPAAD